MNIHMFGIKSNKSKSDLKKVNIPTGSEAHAEDIWTTGEQDALHIPILGSGAEQDLEDSSYKPDLLNPFGVYVSEEVKNAEAKNETLQEVALSDNEPPLLENASIENEDDFVPLLQESELLDSEVLNTEILDTEILDTEVMDHEAQDTETLESDLVESVELPTPELDIGELEIGSFDEADVTGEALEEVLGETLEQETETQQVPASIPAPVVEEAAELIIGLYASSELYVKSLERELSSHCDSNIYCFDSSMEEAQLQSEEKINMWIVNLSDDDESELLDTILEESTEHPTLYLSGSLSDHCKKRIKSFLAENQ